MPARGFKVQTLGSDAQPLFGTTLAAAVTPTPDPYRGNTSPGGNPSYCQVEVTSAAVFRQGDPVIVGTTSNFTAPSTPPATPPDSAVIVGIDYGTNIVTLQGLTRSHASGEFIILATSCAQINIQAVALADDDVLYIGEDSTVADDSTTLIYVLAADDVFRVGASSNGNVWDTSHWWVKGTADDTFLASLITI